MIKTAETYHVPVLLKESVDGLNIQPGGIYVDVTFGGGGHSREILSRLTEGAHLYSFDQDADAERNVVANENFTFVCSNFRFLKNWMRYYGVSTTGNGMEQGNLSMALWMSIIRTRLKNLQRKTSTWHLCRLIQNLGCISHLAWNIFWRTRMQSMCFQCICGRIIPGYSLLSKD